MFLTGPNIKVYCPHCLGSPYRDRIDQKLYCRQCGRPIIRPRIDEYCPDCGTYHPAPVRHDAA